MACTFTYFFQNWLTEKQTLLQELESLLSPIDGFDRNQECSKIIPRVLSHYQRFYNEKSTAANEDVCLILSAPWLTSFERSLLWISGFRPSILFHLLKTSAVNEQEFCDEMKQRIEVLKTETRRKEREITQNMARIQETVAEPPLYNLSRKVGKLVDGEINAFKEAMEELQAAMLAVVNDADALRMSTAAEVVEVLDAVQGVKFLAAAARFELQARKWGLEMDSRRELSSLV